MSRPRLTQQEFNRTLWRAIIPPLLLLAAHASIITVLLIYWAQAHQRSRHSDQVLAATSDLERLLVNMETGYRGYLLTGQEPFLEPYEKSRGRVTPVIANLRNELRDAPAQLDRLARVEGLFRQWSSTEAPPGQAATEPRDPQLLATLNQRRLHMDGMRQQLEQMVDAETELKTTRRTHEEAAAWLAVLGSIGVSIMAGIGLALINRRTVLRLSDEYQQALDDQAASNRQFMDLAEAVPQLIWIADGEGKRLYFNHGWSEYTGRTADQLTSEGWESTMHPEDSPAALKDWAQSMQSGQPFEREYRLKRGSDGTYRWFLCRAVPVVDKEGQRVRWFGSCTDIESKKAAERERETMLEAERDAHNELQRASTIKDQFLATLSHELRTPMSAILGWVRLLRDPVVREQRLDRALEAIDANARAQARLIDDLLDMNRIMTGKLALTFENVDVREVVRAALDAVGPTAHEKGVALIADVQSPRPLQANGDPARLQQVVWNLLSNAVKFTPRGGLVRLSARPRRDSEGGPGTRIEVSDTGQGISADFLPHVFDRFRQGDESTTREHGGLGLGLAIAQHLVEMHGGTISAQSEGLGRGATFAIDLPPATEATEPEAQSPQNDGSLVPRGAQAALSGKCVLVVDDDRESALILQTALGRIGADVRIVHSARDALAALRAQKYDLMLSDIAMPEVDGYALIREVRRLGSGDDADGQHRPALPAVALSAFARPEDRAAALRAGYDAHIAKPVSPDDLMRQVAELLSLRAATGHQ
ncbi:MAG TPA: CHASE3 domain-containing protein [Tepidisphaeraceae bacterium]